MIRVKTRKLKLDDIALIPRDAPEAAVGDPQVEAIFTRAGINMPRLGRLTESANWYKNHIAIHCHGIGGFS
jgi:hypothetical protein